MQPTTDIIAGPLVGWHSFVSPQTLIWSRLIPISSSVSRKAHSMYDKSLVSRIPPEIKQLTDVMCDVNSMQY